jgi:hypothetical protein
MVVLLSLTQLLVPLLTTLVAVEAVELAGRLLEMVVALGQVQEL